MTSVVSELVDGGRRWVIGDNNASPLEYPFDLIELIIGAHYKGCELNFRNLPPKLRKLDFGHWYHYPIVLGRALCLEELHLPMAAVVDLDPSLLPNLQTLVISGEEIPTGIRLGDLRSLKNLSTTQISLNFAIDFTDSTITQWRSGWVDGNSTLPSSLKHLTSTGLSGELNLAKLPQLESLKITIQQGTILIADSESLREVTISSHERHTEILDFRGCPNLIKANVSPKLAILNRRYHNNITLCFRPVEEWEDQVRFA